MNFLGWLFFLGSIILSLCAIFSYYFKREKFESSLSLINIIASFTTILSLTFALSFYFWDQASKNEDIKDENRKALKIFLQEFDSISENLAKKEEFLKTELIIIKERRLYAVPFPKFNLFTMTYIKEKTIELFNESEFQIKIARAIDMLYEIEEDIKSREQYRNSNEIVSTFAENIALIDQHILDKIEKLKPILKEIQIELKNKCQI